MTAARAVKVSPKELNATAERFQSTTSLSKK